MTRYELSQLGDIIQHHKNRASAIACFASDCDNATEHEKLLSRADMHSDYAQILTTIKSDYEAKANTTQDQ